MAATKNTRQRRTVAYIGASFLFTHTSVRDMLLTGGLDETDVVVYDIDREALKLEVAVIDRMIRQTGSAMTVRAARSRRDALDGADYVVVSVLAGGLDLAAKEDRLCRAHGIRHTVGDTIGPMCAARVLRQAPLLVDIARDMEKFCPKAVLISPTNPMAALVTAVSRYTGVTCIGLCHGTQFALGLIAEAYGVAVPDVAVNVVGVNHFAPVDRVWIRGKEIPVETVIARVRQRTSGTFVDPAGHEDPGEMALEYAQRVGFMPNNGDHHFIEFFPWFLSPAAFDADGRNRYGLDDRLLDVPDRRRRRAALRRKLQRWVRSKTPLPEMDQLGGDYVQDVILALEGRPREMTLPQLHLNVPNGRSVPNLPADAILELTIRPTRAGLRPVKNPPLDAYRWGTLSPLVAINELTVQAAMEHDRKAFLQALHLDPLTARFDGLPDLADALWTLNRPHRRPRR